MFRPLIRFLEQQPWLETLGAPLQETVNTVFKDAGPTGKQVQNLLNGVWLGHPLHPVLTDVPVGAWTCTEVLDFLAARSDDPALEKASDITLLIGLLAGLGSALTGLTDWKDTYGRERSTGLLHGLTMLTGTLTYSSSALARMAGNRSAGTALAHLGYLLISAGAYLGGEEVYDLGYPINHTAFEHGPTDFVAVMPVDDLSENAPVKGSAAGVPILLVKQGQAIYCLDDTCVHAGCSLAGGTVEGRTIICPCHGSQYDLRDGAVLNGPATMPEPSYDVRVRDGMIEVKQVTD